MRLEVKAHRDGFKYYLDGDLVDPSDDRIKWPKIPPDEFDRLSQAYGPFDLDAAADSWTHTCQRWLGPGSPLGTIEGSWPPFDRAILNAPYGRSVQFARHAKRALEQSRSSTVLLVVDSVEGYLYADEQLREIGAERVGSDVVVVVDEDGRAGNWSVSLFLLGGG